MHPPCRVFDKINLLEEVFLGQCTSHDVVVTLHIRQHINNCYLKGGLKEEGSRQMK